MLADLGNPPAGRIAGALGVSVRTVQRWIRRDQAPRPVMQGIFWLTSWGRSRIYCDADYTVRIRRSLAESYRREADALRRELARVVALGDFGSANAPTVAPLPVTVAACRPTAP